MSCDCVKKGIARTQSPTIKNYAFELPTFGVIVGVSPTEVQWKGLTLEEPPSWSRFTSTPGKYAKGAWSQPISQHMTRSYHRLKLISMKEYTDCTSDICFSTVMIRIWRWFTSCCRVIHYTGSRRHDTSAAVLSCLRKTGIVPACREIRGSHIISSPYTEIFSKRRKIYSLCVVKLRDTYPEPWLLYIAWARGQACRNKWFL